MKLTLQVEGSEFQIEQFLEMCGFMQRLGEYGASRKFTVSCDGDGSTRMKFFDESGDKIPSYSKDYDLENYRFGFGDD